MATSSRRISKQVKKGKPSRTTSNRSKMYIAIPPKEGWPTFTGNNWGALGLRSRKG